VKLRDDDALGPVDDERSRVLMSGSREVDLLLLDVADDPLPAVAGVVDHELRRHLDGARRSFLAGGIPRRVLRLLQVVGDEDELARAVEVLDRKTLRKTA